MTDPAETPPRQTRFGLQATLSVMAVVAAAGAVFFHLLGDQIHRTYLRQWVVDPDLFPKSTDWILSAGYGGFITFGVQSFVALVKYFWWMLPAAIPLGLYVWILVSPLGLDLEAKHWAWLRTGWGRVISYILKSLLAIVFLPLVILLTTLIAGIPAVIADSVAKSVAKDEHDDFQLGCEKSKAACVQFLKEGNEVGKGYVLDSSPTHIALFDVTLQRARTLEREGLEGVAMRAMRGLLPQSTGPAVPATPPAK